MKHSVRERNIENLKKFGARLKELRESKSISQEKLALKANVAYTTINKIEKGTLNTSISTLFDLAEALEVDKAELLNF